MKIHEKIQISIPEIVAAVTFKVYWGWCIIFDVMMRKIQKGVLLIKFWGVRMQREHIILIEVLSLIKCIIKQRKSFISPAYCRCNDKTSYQKKTKK